MNLELNRLQKVKQRGDKIIAQCPACAEDNRDKTGEHLVIYPDGRFGCSANAGDSEHRKRIFALVGTKDAPQDGPRPIPRGARAGTPPAVLARPQTPVLPPDFARIAAEARSRLYHSLEAQRVVAEEFGLSCATIKAATMPEGGALGFFPSVRIKGHDCHRDRVGYLYPAGIKLRKPWGNLGARFVWACGSATEPWRYSAAAAMPQIARFIITEGESDTLALMEAGIGHPWDADTAVVASPGTSFLPAWAPLFSGKRVDLCFDLDPAGQHAARKVAALLHPHARSVSILTAWKGAGHE